MTRELIRDANAQPIENLVLNPAFRRITPGGGTIKRNLVVNPKFERVTAGTATWRRNIAQNPRLDLTGSNGLPTGWAAWRAQTPAGATVDTTVTAPLGGRVIKVLQQASDIGGLEYQTVLASGKPTSISLWVKTAAWDRLQTPAYGVLPAARNGTWTGRTINGFREYVWNNLIAGAGNRLYLDVSVGGAPAEIWVANVCVEERAIAMPWFDGSSTNDRGIAYAWEGTTGASPSVAKALLTEVRRNLDLDPRFAETSLSYYVGNGSQFADSKLTSITDHPAGIQTAARITMPAGGGWSGGAYTSGRHQPGITPGSTYTDSIWVRFSVARTLVPQLEWLDSSNALVSRLNGSVTYNVPANVWTRITLTGLAPTGAATLRTTYYPSTSAANPWQTGETLDFTGHLVEASFSLGAYFDGVYSGDADLTPAWSGIENSSYSTVSGLVLSNVAYNPANSQVVQSQQGKGLRVIAVNPTSGSNDTTAIIRFPWMALVEGRTYTVLARIRLDAPQSGALYTQRARRINVWNGLQDYFSDAAPNAAGTTLLRLTFVARDVTNTNYGIRLYNGAPPGGGDVFWDQISVVEGVYEGPHFDGDATDDTGFVYAWEGAPHASTSAMRCALLEVRKNFLTNPSMEAAALGDWTFRGAAGSVTISRVMTDAHNGGASAQLVVDGSGSDQGIMQQFIPGTRGLNGTWTFSAWVKAPLNAQMQARLTNNVNAVGTTNFTGTGSWQRVNVSTPTADSTPTVMITTRTAQAVTFLVDEALLELAPVMLDYFDGYMSPDPDLTPVWSGSADVSTSVLVGAAAANVGRAGSSSVAYRALDGSGARFFTYGALVNNGTNRVGLQEGVPTLVVDRTYTAVFRLKAAVASVWAFGVDGSGHPIGGEFAVGTSVTEVRRTFRVQTPLGAGIGFLSPQSPTPVGTLLTIVSADLYPGTYTGPRFDGSTPGCIWRGASDLSPSIGYPHLVALAAA